MSIYVYNAHLDRVVDADTIDLMVDLGFNVKMKMRVRLMGIDAPERYTPEGKAAGQKMQAQTAAQFYQPRTESGPEYANTIASGLNVLPPTLVGAGNAICWDCANICIMRDVKEISKNCLWLEC